MLCFEGRANHLKKLATSFSSSLFEPILCNDSLSTSSTHIRHHKTQNTYRASFLTRHSAMPTGASIACARQHTVFLPGSEPRLSREPITVTTAHAHAILSSNEQSHVTGGALAKGGLGSVVSLLNQCLIEVQPQFLSAKLMKVNETNLKVETPHKGSYNFYRTSIQ